LINNKKGAQSAFDLTGVILLQSLENAHNHIKIKNSPKRAFYYQ